MSVETPEETFACTRCGAEYAGGDSCPSCGALRAPVPCDEHPGRTAHSRCVFCGRPVCEGAADDAGPARCQEHHGVTVIEGWSQVYTTADDLEGALIVQNLRAEGIDAQVYSQKDDVFPVDLGELSIIRVLVPVWEHQAAQEIIAAYSDAAGEVGFACPNCGEVFEPGQAACSACGADLGGVTPAV
ncbi:MAG TPA: hypothetical protein VFQ45_13990 [Longimicrobium sp.]|nr:hypothetical protein [Longimicrobium sp.]